MIIFDLDFSHLITYTSIIVFTYLCFITRFLFLCSWLLLMGYKLLLHKSIRKEKHYTYFNWHNVDYTPSFLYLHETRSYKFEKVTESSSYTLWVWGTRDDILRCIELYLHILVDFFVTSIRKRKRGSSYTYFKRFSELICWCWQ